MDKKIKLLRITTMPYSIHILLRGQLKFMGDNGVEVAVACAEDKEVPDMIKSQNVQYFPIEINRSFNPLKDLKGLLAVIKVIKEFQPDIVHSHSPKAGILGMLAAYICRVPLRIHTIAGLPLVEARGFWKWLFIRVEQLVYFCSNWVLPNSNVQAEYILAHISKSVKPKLHVIGSGSSNGIDLDYFRRTETLNEKIIEFRNQYNIAERDIILCFVGRLVPYKGLVELVDAFQILKQKNDNIKLLLVGEGENENPLEESFITRLQNDRDIILVGFQKEIRPYLAASDIFVFPSYREGFPQSLMQAVAMNLPCIATDINGCKELVFNGKNGFLIPVKDTKSIIEHAQYLIDNPSVRAQMSSFGHQYLLENFEQHKFWEKVLSFYRNKLKEKKKSNNNKIMIVTK